MSIPKCDIELPSDIIDDEFGYNISYSLDERIKFINDTICADCWCVIIKNKDKDEKIIYNSYINENRRFLKIPELDELIKNTEYQLKDMEYIKLYMYGARPIMMKLNSNGEREYYASKEYIERIDIRYQNQCKLLESPHITETMKETREILKNVYGKLKIHFNL